MNKIVIEQIAKVCHEANRAYCETMGDYPQADWSSAPSWQKDSAINGVKAHLGNDLSPADSHASWMKQKESEGWKYGKIKDVDKKEHPCMMPYEQLPLEQKLKDYIFKAIVGAFKDAQIT